MAWRDHWHHGEHDAWIEHVPHRDSLLDTLEQLLPLEPYASHALEHESPNRALRFWVGAALSKGLITRGEEVYLSRSLSL